MRLAFAKMPQGEARGALFTRHYGDRSQGEETLKFISIPAFTLNEKQPDHQKELGDWDSLGGWPWINEAGR